MIPEIRFHEFVNEGEWEETSLGTVVEIKGRIGYRGYTTEDIVEKGKGAITLSPSNFNENGHLNFDKCTFISWAKYEESPEIQLEEGQTVLVKTASVGKTAYVDSLQEKATVNPQIVVLKPKKIQNRFLSFTILHQNTQIQIKNSVGAGAIPNISQEIISKLKILLPPDKNKTEQKKIASCLSSIDEVITAHSQKLDALKDHKKGLMQNLFPQEEETEPKWRFKEFTDSLRKIGFAELGEIKIGLTHKPDYIDAGVPFLSSKNISGGFIDFINIQHISQEKFNSMPNSTKPKLGDILFTRVGSNLGNPIILEDDIEFGIFVSLGFFRVNMKAFNYYLKYWMESDLFWKQVNQKVAGGAKDNLNSTWLKEFELYIPSVQEQQKIASCLSSLDKLITAQAKKIDQLKLHKKGLMQGLFPKIKE